QIDGGSEFNEVFMSDVRVPVENRLGAEGQGWEIVSSALVNERSGIAGSIRFDQALDWLKTTAREQQKLGDRRVRQRVADLATKGAILRWAGMRALTDSLHERMNPHLSAAMKLMSTSLVQEFSEAGMELLGPWAALLDDPRLAPGGRWAKQFLYDDLTERTGTSVGHAVVGGARATFYLRDTPRRVRTVGAVLLPGAAALLFGAPADELAGRHTPLLDLWGRSAVEEARERLLEAADPERQLELFEALLAARLPALRGLHPAVAHALARFPSTGDVGAVVDETGYSHRRF